MLLKKKLKKKQRKLKKLQRKFIYKSTLYNSGYDEGHDSGYDKGYLAAYDKSFSEGHYAGGDAIVDSLLPTYVILPETTIEQIIAAGLEHLRASFHQLLPDVALGQAIIHALQTKSPFSLVRLGDGEMLTMAQEITMSVEQVKKEGSFLKYAGVEIPDLETRDQLVAAVRGATVVGVPKLRIRNYQPLAFSIFRAYGIDYQNLRLTDSLVNYYIYRVGYLSKILQGQKVLIIGNLAQPLSQLLANHGVHVTDPVDRVHGVKDIPRVMGEVYGRDFDIALVSAGISAVIIAQRIASEMGRVAIDFGHMADSLVYGDADFR